MSFPFQNPQLLILENGTSEDDLDFIQDVCYVGPKYVEQVNRKSGRRSSASWRYS